MVMAGHMCHLETIAAFSNPPPSMSTRRSEQPLPAPSDGVQGKTAGAPSSLAAAGSPRSRPRSNSDVSVVSIGSIDSMSDIGGGRPGDDHGAGDADDWEIVAAPSAARAADAVAPAEPSPRAAPPAAATLAAEAGREPIAEQAPAATTARPSSASATQDAAAAAAAKERQCAAPPLAPVLEPAAPSTAPNPSGRSDQSDLLGRLQASEAVRTDQMNKVMDMLKDIEKTLTQQLAQFASKQVAAGATLSVGQPSQPAEAPAPEQAADNVQPASCAPQPALATSLLFSRGSSSPTPPPPPLAFSFKTESSTPSQPPASSLRFGQAAPATSLLGQAKSPTATTAPIFGQTSASTASLSLPQSPVYGQSAKGPWTATSTSKHSAATAFGSSQPAFSFASVPPRSETIISLGQARPGSSGAPASTAPSASNPNTTTAFYLSASAVASGTASASTSATSSSTHSARESLTPPRTSQTQILFASRPTSL
ncbi:hypothetical protein HK105_208332 [Polyrhizophydium stewartii]|uniref:Uncharacterized protein n=1 Tax=Polyrhizophydium stewartii TaxID=2732419 RepID=A0ABR4MY98_9FUNG|nr:hypothetical protein HK105_000012 [Polyrhizophydium stewartii]